MQDFWSPVFLSVKVSIVAVIFTVIFGRKMDIRQII
ncbi:hypothetical protein QF028_000117 [Neobacillus sp. B4I6]